MGVDLRCRRGAPSGDPETRHGPVEIVLPVATMQRQPFAEGRLVDLDDRDACRFQVAHLVADREGDLLAGHLARLVVADEGPVQDRHRAGEHPLHRLLAQRLREGRPAHRHRIRSGDIAEDHRRSDVARAVALHPSLLGEGEPVQLLAEVLHHVVAFRFAMHQHVQP